MGTKQPKTEGKEGVEGRKYREADTGVGYKEGRRHGAGKTASKQEAGMRQEEDCSPFNLEEAQVSPAIGSRM